MKTTKDKRMYERYQTIYFYLQGYSIYVVLDVSTYVGWYEDGELERERLDSPCAKIRSTYPCFFFFPTSLSLTSYLTPLNVMLIYQV
jgi:hypothetical protein